MILVVSDNAELAAGLRKRFSAKILAPTVAARSPGFAVGARIVLLDFSPGTYPVIEQEIFQQTFMLYMHVQDLLAVVGPFSGAGIGPCPLCLAEPCTSTSRHPLLLEWAIATAALELHTFFARGGSTLVSRSVAWSLDDTPGMRARTYTPRPDCNSAGCSSKSIPQSP